MPLGKRSKKKNKSKINGIHYVLQSSFVFMILVFCTLLYVLNLWHNQENDSLFLYIALLFMIYSQTKNQLYALGIPILAVQLLRTMRNMFWNETFIETSDISRTIICNSTFNSDSDIKEMSQDNQIRICKDILGNTTDASFEEWLSEYDIAQLDYPDISLEGSYGNFIAENLYNTSQINKAKMIRRKKLQKKGVAVDTSEDLSANWDISFASNLSYSKVVSQYIGYQFRNPSV